MSTPAVSLSALVQLHQGSLRGANKSPQTVHWYQQQVTAWDNWRAVSGYPDRVPDDAALEAFLAHEHDRGLSARTVSARYRALRAILNWAERRRRLSHDENPVHYVDPPRIPKDRRPFVSRADFDALLAHVGTECWWDQRDRLILLLLYSVGLRVGELIALQVEEVDLHRLEVIVRRGKGSKARTIPAPAELRPAALAYVYARPTTSTHLLWSADPLGRTARPLSADGVRSMLRRRCSAAGTPHYSPHAFRHGFAMWAWNSGMEMKDVSVAMGHSTVAITEAIYAHTLPPRLRRAYDQAWGKAGEKT